MRSFSNWLMGIFILLLLILLIVPLRIFPLLGGALLVTVMPGLCWSYVFLKPKSIDAFYRALIAVLLSIILMPIAVYYGYGHEILTTQQVFLTAAELSLLAVLFTVTKTLYSYLK